MVLVPYGLICFHLIKLYTDNESANRTSRMYRYVALCEEAIDSTSDEGMVTFLRECYARISQPFRLEEDDSSYSSSKDNVEILPKPSIFYKFSTNIDVFKSAQASKIFM
ncbi:unnamed protein product [Acanthoscelides obtectus]|uniref:Uncharacterized protein n=1 Tax=Acanthoscelides obtectus TaxID=200917 RepID=A0A9P0LGY4_ACAOB|nr:unnamed protein product [Acanthoscelides obtectus]CAK1655739.1 hypothetical protein AOBTE_LOCUS19290 [Acanthoscelides obtectus]